MKHATFKIGGLIGAALLAMSCASGPKPRPEPTARVQDSAPEKVAAQRAATGLGLEREDERWGIEAARERRRLEKEKKAKQASAGAAAVEPAEPADVRKKSGGEAKPALAP